MTAKQLPDHHRLEHGADAARRHNVRVGHQHELLQPSEERAVLERPLDERIDVLLEWQLDADADALRASSDEYLREFLS